MGDEIITLRVDSEMKRKMRMIEHINWSSVIRKALAEKIEELKEDNFDAEKARMAAKDIDRIRNSRVFDGGKTGTEIIREWRNKRRF